MEHRLILRLLFVRGLTTFVVGGLGVVDEQNGLRESHILLQLLFVWLDQRRSMPMKPKNFFNWNKNSQILFPRSPLPLGKRRLRVFHIPGVCVNMLCLTLKLDIKLQCMDFKNVQDL